MSAEWAHNSFPSTGVMRQRRCDPGNYGQMCQELELWLSCALSQLLSAFGCFCAMGSREDALGDCKTFLLLLQYVAM